MRAGQLRYSVTIEQQVTTRTSSGAQAETWTTFATVFAGLQGVSGQEYLAAGKLVADANMRIRIRYVSGLTPEMRIKFIDGSSTRYFDILDIDDKDERHREMELLCKERNL